MSDSVQRQRRVVARQAIERRRDLLLLLGSLLLHAGVFSLLPGVTTSAQRPVELLVEIVAPAPPLAALPPAAVGEPAGVTSTEAQATAPADSRRPVPAQAEPAAPVVREQPSQPETAAAVDDSSAPGAGSSASNEATSVIMTEPITAPQSETQVPRQPDPPVQAETAAPAATDTGGGTADDESSAAASETELPGPPSPKPDDLAPVGPASSQEAPAAPATGPPSPPGPSEHELRLLGQYGDAARQRIRSQARNPEHGAKGVVKLEFEVARDGHLIDTWVFESSGHILLDNDALEAAKAAFNDADEKVPFPSDVTVDRWVFQLALEYPLY